MPEDGPTQLNPATIQYSESLDDGSRPLVRGDHDELRVAMSESWTMPSNALPESPRVAVEVAAFDGNRLAVRVTDSGIGIPHGQLKHVFKRFYRIPARMVSQVKGSGLGLFIVRSVVERHGGRVFRGKRRGRDWGTPSQLCFPRA